MRRTALTSTRLRSLVTYNPDTGEMRWNVVRSGVKFGKEVGRTKADGYREAGIDCTTYLVHRLAWLYVHGKWPEDQIDHINGDRSDNRIANLRDVDCTTNHRGYRSKRRNATGFTGVYRSRSKKNGFFAQIYMHGKCVRVGSFNTAEAAYEAFVSARTKYRESAASMNARGG